MTQQKQLHVEADAVGQRLDRFVAEKLPELTRSAVQKLCESGNVFLNGREATKNVRLNPADLVSVCIPEPHPPEAVAQNIPLDIVYEDAHLLVVNKPKGMVVHPAAGNEDGTLVNALLFHCAGQLSGINGVQRPGIVHRIDRDTSGLLVVAKTDAAYIGLSQQIKAHSMQRQYRAVVYGNLRQDSGTIHLPIGRHPVERKKMCVTQRNARDATTHYEVVQRLRGFTHVLLRLETGRTHQIRVHMAHIGHPVAGDAVYGPKKVIASLRGQCLHAQTLGFTHPVTGQPLLFSAPPPAEFTQFLTKLERELQP